MPGIWYSTGSSIVTMLVRSDRIDASADDSVVVLPDPVGPLREPCRAGAEERSEGVEQRRHAELFERWHSLSVIQQTQDDLLAEDGPQRTRAGPLRDRLQSRRGSGRPAAAFRQCRDRP